MKKMVELLQSKKGQTSDPTPITTSTSGNHFQTITFLLIIIGLHIFDIMTGFSRGGFYWTLWLIIHVLLALVIAPLLLDEEGFTQAYLSKRVIMYFIVSVLAFVLPYLIQLLGEKILSVITQNFWFRFILIVSPVWGVFLIFTNQDDPWIALIRKVWVFMWILLFVFMLIGVAKDLDTPATVSAGGLDLDAKDTFSDAWQMGKTNLRGALDKLRGIGPSIGSFVNRQLNDSIGYSYGGQVDQYSEGDLGVRFVNIRSLSSEYREGSDIVLWADIKGESFKEAMTLNTRCYALDDDDRLFEGEVTLQGVKTSLAKIRMRETISMMCRFEDMPEGHYDVTFVGTFNFKTMAYIQYYFAPFELIQNLWMQDIDPAMEAGIPSRPIGRYTSGPVELGLASEIDQPIPIEFNQDTEGSIVSATNSLAPFGASIINAWPDGEVASARYIKLFVPPEFQLVNCDTPDADGEKEHPVAVESGEHRGYQVYTFGDLDGQSLNYNFESVTCYLQLADDNAAESLVASFDLTMKTFGAEASYLYTIREEERIEVESRRG